MAETLRPAGETLEVVVAWHWDTGDVREWPLRVPRGTTVRAVIDALEAVTGRGWATLEPALVGLWGRSVAGTQEVAAGDRIEIYRPLLVDPKRARRERFKRQGTRGAGLFAKRRPGAKAGY